MDDPTTDYAALRYAFVRAFWKQTVDVNLNTHEGCEEAADVAMRVVSDRVASLEAELAEARERARNYEAAAGALSCNVTELGERAERAEAALKYYADRRNFHEIDERDSYDFKGPGARARAALAAATGEAETERGTRAANASMSATRAASEGGEPADHSSPAPRSVSASEPGRARARVRNVSEGDKRLALTDDEWESFGASGLSASGETDE